MNSFFSKLMLFFLIVLVGLYYAPRFMSWEHLKTKIVSDLSKDINREISTKGLLKIEFLPIPSFELDGINIGNLKGASPKDMFDIKQLSGKLAILPLLKGRFYIKSLTLTDAEINLEVLKNHSRNWDFIYGNKFLKTGHFILSTLNLEDCNIHYFLENSSKKSWKGVSAEIDITDSGLSIESNMVNKNSNAELTAVIYKEGDSTKAKWTITTEDIESKFIGDFNPKQGYNWQMDGNLTIKVKSGSFYSSFVSNLIPAVKGQLDNKLKNENIIEGKFHLSDKTFSSKKFTIKSQDVEGVGSVSMYVTSTPHLDLKLNFAKLNLDSMFQIENDSSSLEKDETIDSIASNDKFLDPNFVRYMDFDINLSANDIKLKGSSFKNFIADISLNGDILKLKNLYAETPNKSKLEVRELVTKKIGDVYVLLGSFSFSGKNIDAILKSAGLAKYIAHRMPEHPFSLTSDVIIAPKEVSFVNIKGSIKEGSFGGVWAIRKGREFAKQHIELDLQSFNLDHFLLPTYHNYLIKIITTSQHQEYLSEFSKLRQVSDAYLFDFKIKDSTFQGKNIKNLDFKASFNDSILDIDVKELDSDFASFAGELSLDVKSLKPNLKVKIEGDKLNLDDAYRLPIGDKKDSIASKDTKPIKEVAREKEDNIISSHLSKKDFDFFRIDKFEANIDLNLKDLTYRNMNYKTLNLNSRVSNGMLYFDSLLFHMYSGRFSGHGTLSLNSESPSLSLSYSISDFKLLELLNSLAGVTSITGNASMSGSIFTKGNSPYEWASSVVSNNKISAIDLTLAGIDLKQIISIADYNPKLKKYLVYSLVDEAFKKGISKLKSLDGQIIINKGIVKTNDIVFETNRAISQTAAALNINNGLINLQSLIRFKPKGGGQNADVMIKLQGPLDKYKKTVEDKAFKKFLAEVYGIKSTDFVGESDIIKFDKSLGEQSDYIFKKFNDNKSNKKD